MKENNLKFVKIIKDTLRRKALGYERSLDFAYGFITGLLNLGFVTRKFYNELIDNFAVETDEDMSAEEVDKNIIKKYKRLISCRKFFACQRKHKSCTECNEI